MKHLISSIATGMALVVMAGILPGLVAAAKDTPSAPEMVFVEDRAYGDKLSYGAYEKAIARLSRQADRFPNRDPFATATNLCVAHTTIGQYEKAELYCNKALTVAEKTAVSGRKRQGDRVSGLPVMLGAANDDWAQAYSNRGVLRAMSGNIEGAANDFRQAIALEADSAAAANNLAWLEQATDGLMAGNPN